MLSANWFLGEEKFQLNTVSDNISFVLICFIGNLAMRVQIWASLVTQLVKNLPAMQETWVRYLDWEDIPWRWERLPTPVFWPGKFQGLYSPWGLKQSDKIE